MSGIAGAVITGGTSTIERNVIEKMSSAIAHRGRDDHGTFISDQVGLASQRNALFDVAGGRQPLTSSDGDIIVVYDGAFFDHAEQRTALESEGFQFRTNTDGEILIPLWKKHGEAMLEHLRGQFAFALYDKKQQTVILARDRLGITPLFWARRGRRLYFASEIKGLLASGGISPAADLYGLDHIFTFIGMGTRRTAFKDVWAIQPGNFMRIQLSGGKDGADVTEHRYWSLDFPDQGEEYDPGSAAAAAEEFGEVFHRSIERRLRADVPVVGYLSGGLDSTAVMHAATQIKGEAPASFTIQVTERDLDETDLAKQVADDLGSELNVVTCTGKTIADVYPQLVMAAESPVMNSACAALFTLAREVRSSGYAAALTGEGADDVLAGYPWLKADALIRRFGWGRSAGSTYLRLAHNFFGSKQPWGDTQRVYDQVGGSNGFTTLFGLIALTRDRFYRPEMHRDLQHHSPYYDVAIDSKRVKNWHPLNRGIYLGLNTFLPGLLMNHKGDRSSQRHGVQTRYPFLDEDLIEFASRLHPKWKLRSQKKDKWILRNYAFGKLPDEIARRPKELFKAPFSNDFFQEPPDYVEQLLSDESLEKVGYFDIAAVRDARKKLPNYGKLQPIDKLVDDLGLTAVMATQLWHHQYLGGGLCDLPEWEAPQG